MITRNKVLAIACILAFIGCTKVMGDSFEYAQPKTRVQSYVQTTQQANQQNEQKYHNDRVYQEAKESNRNQNSNESYNWYNNTKRR